LLGLSLTDGFDRQITGAQIRNDFAFHPPINTCSGLLPKHLA
jgi:hypothetical protein